MSLLKCPECDNEVSTFAIACPKCGCPVAAFKYLESEKSKESLLVKVDKSSCSFSNTNIKVGNIIEFGTYQQTEYEGERTPIEWQVLDVKDDKALVISKCILDCQYYHDDMRSDVKCNVSWGTCSLRNWLNSTFLCDAFNIEEQAKILSTMIFSAEMSETSAPFDPHELYLEDDTENKLFLLSISEAKKYFETDEERKCLPTDCVIDRRTNVSKYCYNEIHEWWLRSLNESGDEAGYVNTNGQFRQQHVLHKRDYDVFSFYFTAPCGVRPAMWISLN